MAKAKTPRKPREIVKSREEAIAQFSAAANKILVRHTDAEKVEWVNRTVDAYIAKGIIAVRP